MKQFLYLDTDIVNSIIAQSEQGLIQSFSDEKVSSETEADSSKIAANVNAQLGGSLAKLVKAEANLSGSHDEGVDLLPFNIELSGLEVRLINAISRESVLKTCVNEVKKNYDYVLVDCMPSLGMLTIALTTYASYAGMAMSIIIPYFKERNISLANLKAIDIQTFYM